MICEKNKCTGCFACYNICPKNAIEMIEDEYGNIYPKINKDKCSNCNLCKKICPSINMIDGTKSSEVYAAYSKDENRAVWQRAWRTSCDFHKDRRLMVDKSPKTG